MPIQFPKAKIIIMEPLKRRVDSHSFRLSILNCKVPFAILKDNSTFSYEINPNVMNIPNMK